MFNNPRSILEPILVYDDGRVLNLGEENKNDTTSERCTEDVITHNVILTFDDVKDLFYNVLRESGGSLSTAYQLCKKIKNSNPMVWNEIVRKCPKATKPSEVQKTDVEYSAEVFVSQAFHHFSDIDKHLIMRGIFLGKTPDIEPGATDLQKTTVWSWRPAFKKTIR